MQNISLYVNKKSFVHDVDFLTKLIYIFVFIAIPIISGSVIIGLLAILISLILHTCAGVLKKLIPIVALSLFVLLSVIIVQAAFIPGYHIVFFSLGPVHFYQEGLIHASLIIVRFLDILLVSSLTVLTTRPSDIVETLQRKGLSHRMGYVINSIFQIIPQMVSSMKTISDAQRSRGMETEGNLFVRVKAFLPLIGPVVISSLVGTRERAMALEARAFSADAKRTYFHEEMKYRYKTPVRIILLLLLVVSIIWRVL
ncbi:energy-coupling factor transporter transmembrane protein EcfT [Sporolactobacillus shoreae]|uniref:Energy-coupling factor transporter transmembrane protein EcfT n=1 Tax=Sporolactobacillus shoreae TaxID=1465501 RepID=A0A4Z0GN02_9BACL|nr:energy-coupling factor transporter transmembrane component T [Sporolactobacillus shoreae]TGA97620.1 energy-coupling factor transporter transmembrane protein EcfT [Sporolactobacillus shoreae]